MKGNFDACLQHTLQHEGGWSDHPSDPGGATMQGITLATYAAWRGRSTSKAELRAIKPDTVAAIYRQRYWDKVQGDMLPPGVDLVAFDAAVNSGPDRGARWLQEAAGVTADARIGPVTLLAVGETPAAVVIGRACDVRMAFLRRLGTWSTFGRGWTSRVAGVRTRALQMASQKPVPRPAPIPTAPALPGWLRWINRYFGG